MQLHYSLFKTNVWTVKRIVILVKTLSSVVLRSLIWLNVLIISIFAMTQGNFQE